MPGDEPTADPPTGARRVRWIASPECHRTHNAYLHCDRTPPDCGRKLRSADREVIGPGRADPLPRPSGAPRSPGVCMNCADAPSLWIKARELQDSAASKGTMWAASRKETVSSAYRCGQFRMPGTAVSMSKPPAGCEGRFHLAGRARSTSVFLAFRLTGSDHRTAICFGHWHIPSASTSDAQSVAER